MDSRSKKLLVLTLVLIFCAAAYGCYRFFVLQDYVLQYEARCDAQTEQCFISECTDEDDEDCEPTPYKLMQKYAYDVRRDCGTDVSECSAASTCYDEDELCVVQYCDPEAGDEQCAPIE